MRWLFWRRPEPSPQVQGQQLADAWAEGYRVGYCKGAEDTMRWAMAVLDVRAITQERPGRG